VKYEFPWPPRELSPNVSVHWRTLGKAKQEYKEACGWIIRAGFDPIPLGPGIAYTQPYTGRLKPPVTAQVTFVCDARRRDPDNHMAMLKPLWDALVEMGVLEDDSHDKLKIAEPKWERGEKKVIVELSPYRNGGSDAE
jgi:crossover junction endodeoxyribonuclease RusA